MYLYSRYTETGPSLLNPVWTNLLPGRPPTRPLLPQHCIMIIYIYVEISDRPCIQPKVLEEVIRVHVNCVERRLINTH